MLASLLAYTYLAPTEYDGEPYIALSIGAEMTSTVGIAAALWVIAYLAWTLRHNSGVRLIDTRQHVRREIHPGEWWVVLAHAVAFGSGYVLGASNVSFLLVLAVHHEVQYLYFAYAMARRSGNSLAVKKTDMDVATKDLYSKAASDAGGAPRSEVKFVARFLLWPVIGFTGAIVGSWLTFAWLAPLGIGGLFCHYWLDGRIWTRQSLQN